MRYMSVGRLGRIFCVCALLTRVARSSAPSVVVFECLQVRGGGWTSMEQARCFVSQVRTGPLQVAHGALAHASPHGPTRGTSQRTSYVDEY